MKSRHLVMDDMDDAMFSLALRDVFPTALFLPGGRPATEPRLHPCRSIPECDGTAILILVPEPGWQAKFRPNGQSRQWYVMENPPPLHLLYSRTTWFRGGPGRPRWAFDLPAPEFGTINTNYDRGDAAQRRFVNTVWRVLARLTTNRLKAGIDADRFVRQTDVRGQMVWVGHHVLEWCAGAPKRMIGGNRRPCDDWEPPETSWYRDLRARAESAFGADYGGPPGRHSQSVDRAQHR